MGESPIRLWTLFSAGFSAQRPHANAEPLGSAQTLTDQISIGGFHDTRPR